MYEKDDNIIYDVKIDRFRLERWYNKHEDLHRGDNKPIVIFVDGNEEFWLNGIRVKQSIF